MKVFISWSGERSRAVADLLDGWIQCVLQAATPWMSSKDIDRGSLWFSEISDQLKDTRIGIVCLTKSNLDKPWILFESGALAKGLSSARVCTFLIDLDSTDVSNPLAQFNHTTPDKTGLFELIRTLNSALGDQSLKEQVLEQVFETYWPQFQSKFDEILQETGTEEQIPERSDESILTEVLRTVRILDRRIRNLERPGHSALRRENTHPDMEGSRLIRNVYNMLKEGLPTETILEAMGTDYSPKSIINAINISKTLLLPRSDNDGLGEEKDTFES